MTKKPRSGHRKSTRGCVNCKRRHIKCDETRPACIQCITQQRQCPYQDALPVDPVSIPVTAGSPSTNTPSTLRLQQSAVQLNLPTPWFDLLYIELLQQWLDDTHLTYVFNDEHARIYGPTIFNYALAFPFLMHGILANAALHLSVVHPAERSHYRTHAEELLWQALVEFNATLNNLDATSIVPAFLFSHIACAHQMVNCFQTSAHNFDDFLGRFVECLRLSRGINIIIQGWWNHLQSTELRPILTIGDQLRMDHDLDRQIPELDAVRDLIETCRPVNSTETTQTYVESVEKLQLSYNVHSALNNDNLNRSLSWAFSWPINVPVQLAELLEMRRPEALVLLAHFAPLLHHRRSCWALQNAGVSMFGLIDEYLGHQWSTWLHKPLVALGLH